MLKKLIPCVFLLYSGLSLASQADVSIMGEIAMFDKPLEVAVTVIEKTYSLVYWAQPLAGDAAGIEAVQKFVETSRTNNAIPDPFVFQFRFAGVESAVQEGADLTHDGFQQEVDQAIEKTVVGKKFVLKCYGYFTSHVVPFCDAYDRDGVSVSQSLIKQGMVIPNAKLGIVTEEQREQLDQALEEAKKAQVGTWRPFHGMFRGLEME